MSLAEVREPDRDALTLVRTYTPTLELATMAQPIGYAAWKDAYREQRSDSEIRNVFNPDNPRNAEQLLNRMRSKIGKFVFVSAYEDDELIGYAWAAEDVGNMSPSRQRVKTYVGAIFGKKPFVWNAQLNVLPECQNNGIGSALLTEVNMPFKQDMAASVYVVQKNRRSTNFFKKRGFMARPDLPYDPNKTSDGADIYFGEGAKHSMQGRFESESIEHVIKNISNMHILPSYFIHEV